MSPRRRRALSEHVVDGAAEGLDGEAADSRLPGGQRDDVGSRRAADEIPERRVGRLQRACGDLSAPREWCRPIVLRGHERAAADVAAHEAFGFECSTPRRHCGCRFPTRAEVERTILEACERNSIVDGY